jgi:TonB family protein
MVRRGVVLCALAAALLGAILVLRAPGPWASDPVEIRRERPWGGAGPPGPTAAEESGVVAEPRTGGPADTAAVAQSPESGAGGPDVRERSRSVQKSRSRSGASRDTTRPAPVRAAPQPASRPSDAGDPVEDPASSDSAQAASAPAETSADSESAQRSEGRAHEAEESALGEVARAGEVPGVLPPPASEALADPSAGEGSRGPGQPRPADAALPAPPVLTPPVLLSDPSAEASPPRVTLDRSMLTPQARHVAMEGVVVLAGLVRRDGSPADVRVRTSSGDQALDAAAARAAGAWRFRPATREGTAMEAWAIIPVRFVVR